MLPTWRILSPQLNNLPCYYGRRRCRLYQGRIVRPRHCYYTFVSPPPSFLPPSRPRSSSISVPLSPLARSPKSAPSLYLSLSLPLPLSLSLPFLPRPLCAAAGPRRATRKSLRRRQWGKGESASTLTIGCVRARRWGSYIVTCADT